MGCGSSSSTVDDSLVRSSTGTPVLARRLQTKEKRKNNARRLHSALNTSSSRDRDSLWRSPMLARRLLELENKNDRARQQKPNVACSSGRHQAPMLLGKSKLDRGTGTVGKGKRLGGEEKSAAECRVDAEELRLPAFDASERRQNEAPGISKERAASMQERQKILRALDAAERQQKEAPGISKVRTASMQ